MRVLKVRGNTCLRGEIKVSGAKNSATKLLIASLISDKKTILSNVPDIGDVRITVDLCKEIGSQVNWDKKKGTLEIHTPEIIKTEMPKKFFGVNRIPILILGALLGRTKKTITVPSLGGDAIGNRSIDYHEYVLRKFGGIINYEQTKEISYTASAKNGLKGCVIDLPFPSVGATENAIFSSCRAKGKTIINNAALEPEVVDLLLFLQKIGLQISFNKNRRIEILGIKSFKEVKHTILPDRIEAASYGMAAVATKGRIFVKGANHLDLSAFIEKLRELGGGVNLLKEGIEFFYSKPLKGGLTLSTDVHPGFISDWQQPFSILLTQAKGFSIVHETIYENRLGFLRGLKKMGAEYEIFNKCLTSKPCRFCNKNFSHSVVIKGITPLKSSELHIPDLRAGFAYLMAGFIAEGDTLISGVDYLDRGYENYIEKMRKLGADIDIMTSLNSKKIKEVLPKKEKILH